MMMILEMSKFLFVRYTYSKVRGRHYDYAVDETNTGFISEKGLAADSS